MRSSVRRQIESGAAGLCPLGGTGEPLSLSLAEHFRVVDTVVEEAAGRVPVTVGCLLGAQADIVAVARHAKDRGRRRHHARPALFLFRQALRHRAPFRRHSGGVRPARHPVPYARPERRPHGRGRAARAHPRDSSHPGDQGRIGRHGACRRGDKTARRRGFRSCRASTNCCCRRWRWARPAASSRSANCSPGVSGPCSNMPARANSSRRGGYSRACCRSADGSIPSRIRDR